MLSSGVGFSSLTKQIPVACGSSNSKRRSAPDVQAKIARKTAGRSLYVKGMQKIEGISCRGAACCAPTFPTLHQYPWICTKLGLVSNARCGIGNITLYAPDTG